MTTQDSPCNHTTVYGISKLAGEQWCSYYHHKFGVDVRSLRYPGLIGYKSVPGGGTTDYAVDIYHKAIDSERFECFLKEDMVLHMMYMDDAVKATIELMEAPSGKIRIRTSYNIAAISFYPEDIADAIRTRIPGLFLECKSIYLQDDLSITPSRITVSLDLCDISNN